MKATRSTSIDYERCAALYPASRRADPRIAAHIEAALGDARTIVNVGAGAGSYEPYDRDVIAIEPSPGMRAQRQPHLVPAIDASAESLPLADGAVDAAMAIITIHHWRDLAAGLREMRRVSRGPVVLLTFDVELLADFWMVADYLPEALIDDRKRFPSIQRVIEVLGGGSTQTVPIPIDCTDGFFEAYYARPEAYLDPAVRAAADQLPALRWPPRAPRRRWMRRRSSPAASRRARRPSPR